jgi:hypothetical protein
VEQARQSGVAASADIERSAPAAKIMTAGR